MHDASCNPAAAEAGLLTLPPERVRPGTDEPGAVSPAEVQARLQRLLGDARSAAFLLGCAALHECLTADFADGCSALDEEQAAVVASRRALLPAFQCRMHYPAYRARGLRVTSGKVEGANCHVTGARLKCQGMRWDEAGAAQMALLRADLFNDRWASRTRQVLAVA